MGAVSDKTDIHLGVYHTNKKYINILENLKKVLTCENLKCYTWKGFGGLH
jgi:hypothetical protein